uniref:Uncharacterized protein n=1 Tax=Anguilla anguilla TaxID=7936 RepID=A0A0E9P608_ANGAN
MKREKTAFPPIFICPSPGTFRQLSTPLRVCLAFPQVPV